MAVVEIRFVGQDQASGAARQVAGAVREIGPAAQQSQGGLRGLIGMFADLTIAAGPVLGAIQGGFQATIGAGLAFNNQMEQTSAKINAFTKDGEATAQILDMIRERAAATPFEFSAMADAAAALMPAAKASGQSLEDLIAQAEILAASNPAEGLAGAAFSLREALSGDYTSIIERFNLSRTTLNDLKKDGVPAMEAISRAMKEMGYDQSLVTNMAATFDGRMSTLKDTFTGLMSTISQPLFNALSGGVAQFNGLLTENAPLLQSVADNIAGWLSGAIEGAIGLFQQWGPVVMGAMGQVAGVVSQVAGVFGTFFGDIQTGIDGGAVANLVQRLLGLAGINLPFEMWTGIATAFQLALDNIVGPIGGVVSALMSAGPFSQQFVSAMAGLGPTAQVVGAALSAVPTIISTIISVFSDPGAIQAWGGAFTEAQNLVTGAMTAIQGIVGPILTIISGFWAQHGGEITAFTTQAWAQIGGIVTTTLQIIQGIVIPILTGIGGFISSHSAEIQSVLGMAWNYISGVVGGALTFLQGMLNTVLLAIQGDWSGAWANLQSTAATLVTDIISSVENGMKLMEGTIRLAWEGIKTAALSLGGDVVAGIIKGVEGAAGGLLSAMRDLAMRGLDAAKKALGISSPSKRAADEIGAPLVQGVSAGVRSALGTAEAAVGGAAQSLLGRMRDAFDVYEDGSWIFWGSAAEKAAATSIPGRVDLGLKKASGRDTDSLAQLLSQLGGGAAPAAALASGAAGGGRSITIENINVYGAGGASAVRQDARAFAYEIAREIERNIR